MRNREAGISLIEYLIASTAGMIVLGAAFTLMGVAFTANARAREVIETQQSVRVAMNTIARDITMAGTGLPSSGIAVPNGVDSDPIPRPGVGGTLVVPNNTLAILSPGNGAGPEVRDAPTDALTILSINQESPTWTIDLANIPNSTGTRIDFLQNVYEEGEHQLFEGDLLVLTNANGSVFGCVTSVTEANHNRAFFANNDVLDINQPNAASGNVKSLANADGSWPPTTAVRVNLATYYLDDSLEEHPRLMRVVNGMTPQVLVEDIENLQFSFDLFDFETNDSTANQATTDLPNQIRSVHVSITGRSAKTLDRSDEFHRFSLVSKINVRNATFRNRYVGEEEE